MTRRRLLATIAAVSAPVALPAAAAREDPVVIIGAGIAGLAAADRLRRARVPVVVVEARQRIGGRIWTSRLWPGLPIDLGASWIHGIEGNPVTDLANAAGLAMVVTDYDSAVIHDADGDELTDAGYDRVDAIAEALFYGVEQAMRACRSGDRRSVADAVAGVFDLGALSGVDRRLLDFLLASVIEHDLGADVSELGLCLVDADDEFDGPDAILPAGYDAIANGLAAGLDIRLGVAAHAVALTSAGVSVETDAGRIDASAAVVTVPLGVLKAGAIRFEPALPQAKQAAIADLGSGLLNKTVLRFPGMFWDPDDAVLHYVSHSAGLWAETFSLGLLGAPVLMGFNAGSVARGLETRSDRDTVASMMEMLRAIYGNGAIDPVAWQVTRWSADPLALGAYSYEPPSATLSTRAALAEPVAGRLFFAGEATSEAYPATVHGALLSGRRAAAEILAG